MEKNRNVAFDALDALVDGAFAGFESLRRDLKGWLTTMPAELREGAREWPDIDTAISGLERVVSEPVLCQGMRFEAEE